MENNDPRQIEIRKYRSILRSIGAGIVVFSSWSVFKSIGVTLLNPEETLQAMTAVSLVVDLLMRIYVGRSAIAVGNGEERGKTYIVFAILMVLGSVIILAFICFGLVRLEAVRKANGIYTSMFIEITSTVLVVEMIIVAMKLRIAERRKAGR